MHSARPGVRSEKLIQRRLLLVTLRCVSAVIDYALQAQGQGFAVDCMNMEDLSRLYDNTRRALQVLMN